MRPDDDAPRSARPVLYTGLLVLVALLAIGVRGWLIARPLAFIDGRTIPDDAYISLEIARNIGQGHGPRFRDYATNGFQPLYVWLMAVPMSLVSADDLTRVPTLDALVKQALVLGAVFDVGSLLLLAAILRRAVGVGVAPLFAALVWALHPALLRTALNGLETSLAVFCLLLVWRLSLRWPFAEARPQRLFLTGLAVGVGAMARIDLLMVGPCFAFASLRLLVARRALDRDWLARNAALGGGVAVGYAPWLLYSWAHTGQLFPLSGRALRFMALSLYGSQGGFAGMPAEGWSALQRNGAELLWGALAVVGVAAAVGGSRAARGRVRPRALLAELDWLLLPASFAVCLFLAYTLYLPIPWYMSRYLLPIVVTELALLAWGLDHALRLLPRRPGAVIAGLVFGLTAAGLLAHGQLGDLLFGSARRDLGYRNLALWARGHFPDGTAVGSGQTGALAYYATNLRIVNLDGVVNERALRSRMEGRHLDYIRDEDIRFVLGWDWNIRGVIQHSRGFRPEDWVYRGEVEGIRSWNQPWHIFELPAHSR